MKSIPFSLLFLLFLASCDMSELDNADRLPSKSLIDSQFELCYYEDDLALRKCDSVLDSIFGSMIVEESIRFDLAESSMNCQVDDVIELVPFGDTNHCVPNSYDLLYTLSEGYEIIYSFRMTAREDMRFQVVSTIVADQLLGYRYLLSDQFKINYAEAKKITQSNGVDMNESLLELVRDEDAEVIGKNAYHWEAELEYDHNSVTLLIIDVMTGATSKEVLTIEDIE